jgi:hypothetical protein
MYIEFAVWIRLAGVKATVACCEVSKEFSCFVEGGLYYYVILRHMKITFYNQLTICESEELSAPSRNQAREAPLVGCPVFFFSIFTSICRIWMLSSLS